MEKWGGDWTSQKAGSREAVGTMDVIEVGDDQGSKPEMTGEASGRSRRTEESRGSSTAHSTGEAVAGLGLPGDMQALGLAREA